MADVRLGGAVALGLGLRLYHYLRCPSVWHDEAAIMINIIRKDFLSLLGPLEHTQAAPPLFLWLERLACLVAGDAEWVLRFLPFVLSCASVLLFAGVARRMLGRAAWCAVLLFAVSDRLLWHSVECKPYALDVFIAVLGLQLYLASEHQRLRPWLLLSGILCPVGLSLSYPACFVIAGLMLAWLVRIVAERSWVNGLVLAGSAILVSGTFLTLMMGPIQAQRNPELEAFWLKHFPDWHHPGTILPWTVKSMLSLGNYAVFPIGWLLMGLVCLGTWHWGRMGRTGWLLMLLTPMAAVFLAACLHAYPFAGGRLLVFTAPGLMLLSVAGFQPLQSWLSNYPMLRSGVIAVVLLPPVLWASYRVILPWPRIASDRAAVFVQGHRQPREAIVHNHWDYLYYFRNELPPVYHWKGEPLPQRQPFWLVISAKDSQARASLLALAAKRRQVVCHKEFPATTVVLLKPGNLPSAAPNNQVGFSHKSGAPMLTSTRWLAPWLGLSLLAGLAGAEQPPAPLVGNWEGTLKTMGIELRIVLHLKTKEGQLTGNFDSLDQGAKGIPIDKLIFEDGTLTLKWPKLGAEFAGKLSPDGKTLKGEWKQSGLRIPTTFTKTKQVKTDLRPQEPKPPFSYAAEEVRFDNPKAQITFGGTLTKPKQGGPFPAIVLLSGSGAQDRDETIFGHKPFWVLADHLTRNGIAVLRFDDRGVGDSGGDQKKTTMLDHAEDALAAVRYLKDRKDIDPKKIGLIGHSEGALLAALAAEQSNDVALIVMLAGNAIPGDELLYLQAGAILEASGVDEKTREKNRAVQKAFIDLVRKKESPAKIEEAFARWLAEQLQEVPEDAKEAAEAQLRAEFRKVQTPWMRHFIDFDPQTTLRKIACPVLVLIGELDRQVPPDPNLQEARQALLAGGNTDVTVKELPKLNHLFQTAKTGTPQEYRKIEETFAPAALKEITTWIAPRFR